MKLKNFTLEQIMRWLRKAYVSFYLRPKFFLWDIVSKPWIYNQESDK